jgi:hypothetical protein
VVARELARVEHVPVWRGPLVTPRPVDRRWNAMEPSGVEERVKKLQDTRGTMALS